MKISIKADFADVNRMLAELPEKVGNKAMARTLNATVAIAKTAMVKEISHEYAVTARYVRERLVIKRSKVSGAMFEAQAELMASNMKRSANVIAFKAREVKAGVSVKISKAGPRKVLSGAFIGNKGRTVFTRVPGTTMASRAQHRGVHAEQIKPVQTIDVPQMFNAKRINGAVVRVIEARLQAIAEREIRYALQQAGIKP